ncbi:hypothetical protein EV383_1527 [Pseudonocardia sediminis]|uniref:Proline-rich protein n=2 Tax=Pseudonocardia sediminis TaxID=1397368 RepID=A0A4Q7UUH8_PSEST|nr:hypothetical protein EV383_1527 [Pseudonocardia sediminis]
MGTESSGSGTSMSTEKTESIGTGDATTRIPDVTTSEYLDGLRAALSDLPAEELGEITEDARGHLADLASELGEGYDRAAVHARLGSPAEYAAELRAAAGFPARPAPSQSLSRWSARFAVLALLLAMVMAGPAGLLGASGEGAGVLILALLVSGVGVLAVLRDGPGLRSVADLDSVTALRRRPALWQEGTPSGGVTAFLASLQPGWWVLRGVVGAGVLVVLFGGATRWEVWAAVLLALVAIPVSVLLGVRARADRRLLWLVVPLNAFAAGALAGVVATLGPDGGDTSSTTYQVPGLVRDGVPVSDVRPFDSAGRPLSGVYLFDSDGRPLTVTDYGCDPVQGSGDRPGPYPRGTTSYDPDTGACVWTPPAPLVVSIPGATPAPRATTAPTTPPAAATPAAPSAPTAPAAPSAAPR